MSYPRAFGYIGTFFLSVFLSFVFVTLLGIAKEPSEPGEQAYSDARSRIASGDFGGAVQSLQWALRHDIVNKKYTEELNSVREIIKIREEFAAREKGSPRWNLLAQHLRHYYQKNQVRAERIDISLQIFDCSKLTYDAVCVMDAMIQAERLNDALDFADSIDEKGENPSIQIAKGFVLYSADRKQEARKLARSLPLDNLKTSDDLLRLARLQAATGLSATSVQTLTRCFELTPDSLLPERKERVVRMPEFEPLLTSSEFAIALTTQSKQESIDRACSVKWVGVVFDQRPKYIRDLSKGPINPDDWKVK